MDTTELYMEASNFLQVSAKQLLELYFICAGIKIVWNKLAKKI